VTGADTRVILAGLTAATGVATAVGQVVRPPRRLAPRVRPYAQLSRSRLGTGSADAAVLQAEAGSGQALAAVFGPMARRLAHLLGELIDAAPPETLELRLRQAGFAEITADQNRMRQLAWAVGAMAAGVAVGLALGQSAAVVLLLAGLMGFPGATYWRSRVNRAIESRRARMRVELYTVAQLLAVYTRTGHGPVEAVREVTRRGRGPVVGELAEALGWISGGTAPQAAYERLAEVTAEPAAARLYRTLAAAAHSGGDIARGLLAFGEDLRNERAEEIARGAIRRRSAMLVPLLVLVAPVMLLFVAAALPHLVFGR
jgi:tight adherence protein C